MKNAQFLIIVMLALVSCGQSQTENLPTRTPYSGEKIEKSNAEWQDELTSEEYHVLRERGTERAFTGEFWDHHGHGTYVCGACALPLFHSDTKFKSGTGWPSYYQPQSKENVGEISDQSHGWSRVEVVCNRCDGHLGHVFNDGPNPTGLRYCINSASLDFEPKK